MSIGDHPKRFGVAAGIIGALSGSAEVEGGKYPPNVQQMVEKMQSKIADGRPLDNFDEFDLKWLEKNGYKALADKIRVMQTERDLGAEESEAVRFPAEPKQNKPAQSTERKKRADGKAGSESLAYRDDLVIAHRPSKALGNELPEDRAIRPKVDANITLPPQLDKTSLAIPEPEVGPAPRAKADMGQKRDIPVEELTKPERWIPGAFFDPLEVGYMEPKHRVKVPEVEFKPESPFSRDVENQLVVVRAAIQQLRIRLGDQKVAKLGVNKNNWHTVAGRELLAQGGEDTRLARGALVVLENNLGKLRKVLKAEIKDAQSLLPGREENFGNRYGQGGRLRWTIRSMENALKNAERLLKVIQYPATDDSMVAKH